MIRADHISGHWRTSFQDDLRLKENDPLYFAKIYMVMSNIVLTLGTDDLLTYQWEIHGVFITPGSHPELRINDWFTDGGFKGRVRVERAANPR